MKAKRLFSGRMLPALALACVASFAELGPIAELLRRDSSLVPILLAGFAYQLGNVIPGSSNRLAIVASITGVTLGAATIIAAAPGTIPWFASIALLSWSLQIFRRRLALTPGADLPGTAMKRTARVLGFASATVLPLLFWAALTALAVIWARFFVKGDGPRPRRPSNSRRGASIEFTMVLHQTHYFSYCYAIPALLASSVTGGIPAVGIWFACGWITYLSAESLWKRFQPIRVFIFGHLLLAIFLALMTWLGSSPWPVLLLWILSGLGGGSVYCLTLLHKQEGGDVLRLEHAENIGHLLGVAVVLAGTLMLAWTARTLPIVGAAWAGTAAISMFIVARYSRHVTRKPRDRETYP